MSLGGIRGESGHVHHVTECMHEHTHYKKEGNVGAAASANTSVQPSQVPGAQEGQISISAWVDRMLGKGKGFLKGIWGTNETATSGEAGNKSGEAQVLAQIREDGGAEGISANVAGQNGRQPDAWQAMVTHGPNAPQVAAAATAVTQGQNIQDNPYFAAAEEIGGRQDTLWRKAKVRFKDVAGRLAGHLPGRFSGFFQTRNSFQAKQEKPKQDLRKHSKYRKDEVEIDCVLTDDSYLLDSYDRKGEYSKLSTKK